MHETAQLKDLKGDCAAGDHGPYDVIAGKFLMLKCTKCGKRFTDADVRAMQIAKGR